MASSAAIPGGALPGAALRVTRTAVGRRALQVVLLVGGLFALGLLFGEQAHAADGKAPTTPRPVVQTLTDSLTDSVTRSVGQLVNQDGSTPETSSDPSSTVPRVTAAVQAHLTGTLGTSVTDTLRTPVTDTVGGVVQPVGDLVETVTGGLTEALPEALPEALTEVLTDALTPIPAEPPAETVPSQPGLPTLPGTDDQSLPAAGSSAPQSGGAAQDASDSTDAHRSAQRRVVTGARPMYGPVHIGTRAGDTGAPRADQGVRSPSVPAHQAPSDDPTGVPAHQSAGDNGGQRHGDAHAVTPHLRVPLRFVPGASAAVTVAKTRDRFRDIPVFPG